MVGMASAINRPPLRGFRNCGRGISLGINVQQLDSAVQSSHREISEPSLDALGCLVIHFAGKDERRTAAVQDLAALQKVGIYSCLKASMGSSSAAALAGSGDG